MTGDALYHYVLLGVTVLILTWWGIEKIRATRRIQSGRLPLRSQIEMEAARRDTPRLTKPPEPIDRTAFLQARIAYLAEMRNGVEFDKLDDHGKPTGEKIIRPATSQEMIDLVNIRDEDHVLQLLDTWDQVQRKTSQ